RGRVVEPPPSIYRPESSRGADGFYRDSPTVRRSPTLNLPQGFVKGDADRGGQVEAADLAGGHRDADDAAGVTLQQPRRQSARLAAEQQAVARLVLDAGVRYARPGAEAEQPAGEGGLELLKVGVPVQFDLIPVVQPCPAK